jgi:hypothetical protein
VDWSVIKVPARFPGQSQRSLEDSAAFGAEAARGLTSNRSTSAIPESPSPARFRWKVIILELNHNVVLETAPPSLLKLPVDWPATK